MQDTPPNLQAQLPHLLPHFMLDAVTAHSQTSKSICTKLFTFTLGHPYQSWRTRSNKRSVGGTVNKPIPNTEDKLPTRSPVSQKHERSYSTPSVGKNTTERCKHSGAPTESCDGNPFGISSTSSSKTAPAITKGSISSSVLPSVEDSSKPTLRQC